MLPNIYRRIWYIISRLICFLLGVFILLTIGPHQSPRLMKNVQSSLQDKGTVIQVQSALFNREFRFSSTILILAIFLILMCFIGLSRNARNATMEFARRRSFLIGIIPFFWLLLMKMALGFLILAIGLLLIRALAMKKGFSPFLKDAQIFLLRLSALSLFLLTFLPTPGGWSAILYLILGSFGILLILIGIYPFLSYLGNKYSMLRDRAISTGRRLCQTFYESSSFIFLVFIFLFVFALANLGSYFLFDHIPHVTDSFLQVFHGKIFAAGRLVAQSHPLREFFDINPLMINDDRGDGKWYSVYPFGHSFMMMFGEFINAPWIINPLLLALTIVLVYFIGKEIQDEKTGRLSALLGSLSPFLLFMSSEFMNHVSTLLYATLFVLFFIRMIHRAKWYDPIVAGIGLGMLINIRTYTAVAIAIPFCIYSLFLLFKDFRIYVWRITILALTTLCFIGILLGYNYATNGSPTLFGYVAQFGKEHNPGFGHHGHGGASHTFQKGFISSIEALNILNKFLFGWQIPS